MVKNRQKGITKGYRNDKKDVNTRSKPTTSFVTMCFICLVIDALLSH